MDESVSESMDVDPPASNSQESTDVDEDSNRQSSGAKDNPIDSLLKELENNCVSDAVKNLEKVVNETNMSDDERVDNLNHENTDDRIESDAAKENEASHDGPTVNDKESDNIVGGNREVEKSSEDPLDNNKGDGKENKEKEVEGKDEDSPMDCDKSQPSGSKDKSSDKNESETSKDKDTPKEVEDKNDEGGSESSKDKETEEVQKMAVDEDQNKGNDGEDEDQNKGNDGEDENQNKGNDGEDEDQNKGNDREDEESDKKDDRDQEPSNENDGVKNKSKNVESDIEEIPVHKKAAELVDLESDDSPVKNKKTHGKDNITSEDKERSEGDKDIEMAAAEKDDKKDEDTSEGKAKGLKLRSFASLVDDTPKEGGQEGSKSDSGVLKSGNLIPNPEAFGAIGEIVEHKDMFINPDADGPGLQISNVVGGEDCITGLAMDDDRDMLSAIQISSVTTLIDPISPEDPNKDKDTALPRGDPEAEGEKPDTANLEATEDSGIKIVSAESLASIEDEAAEKADEEASGPKLRISSAVSEETKEGKEVSSVAVVYHILRSILVMNRSCHQCLKKCICDFRVTKKGTNQGTYAFLCTQKCREDFVANLKSEESVEKPRLIFEKLCGMCHKDLTSQPRSGQFSWETREFCSEKCLVDHLDEVASKCHTCSITVRPVYIGKYCVRFGSDIHQFCSNHCLERYKNKIKVCCYCQKNVEKVTKVTSPANKEYCSVKCLKRAQRRDIGQQNYNELHNCTVCTTEGLNRYEFLLNNENQQLCSDPCLNVFKYVNKVKAVTCCLCFRIMNAEDVSHYLYHGGHQLRVFCSDSCVNVFILSARKIVVCDNCKVKKYNFDMIHRQVDEDFREYYYCSLHCLQTRDTPGGAAAAEKESSTNATSTAVSSSGNIASANEAPMAQCSMCNNMAKAQFHMVMSDNTLRSFCRYSCASRYKSTFGFLVDSSQPPSKENTTSKSTSTPSIRAKTTSQLASSTTSTNTSQSSKRTTPGLSAEALQATTELLKMLVPPTMSNKTTMCKPNTSSKGVHCRPIPHHKESQTDLEGIDSNLSQEDPPPIIPVPIPCYVPAPMCMYNVPCPIPIFVPIPLPVPIFLPTSAKTSKDVIAMMTKIQDEIPDDPIQAEMLMLARQSMQEEEGEKASEAAEPDQAVEDISPMDNYTSYSGDDEAGNDEAANEELNSADEACLNTMEEDLPRYPLRDSELTHNYANDDDNESGTQGTKRKRKGRGRPRKKARYGSDDDSYSDYDADDPDFMPEPETILEEEFQGPYLNKMYGLTAWKSWVTKKNAELAGVSSSRSMKLISENLLTMNCDELNYALCLFLKDLRKPNGEMYQPDTILYLLLGIQQHLFESARTDCIFMDFGFEKFTNSLDEITRTFWVSPSLPGVPISLGVTRITEAMLWECRQLGAHTPQVLLNTLFYFNTKVFRLKTVEDHLAMSFVQIVKQWRRSTMGRDGSGTRTTLLKYYPKKSANDPDKPRQNYEMHENRDDPLRCPVKLYEFYLSKCPESVRNQRNIYYVYPERSCVPDSPVWFSTQAVHATSIAKMLNRSLMVREVQEGFADAN